MGRGAPRPGEGEEQSRGEGRGGKRKGEEVWGEERRARATARDIKPAHTRTRTPRSKRAPAHAGDAIVRPLMHMRPADGGGDAEESG